MQLYIYKVIKKLPCEEFKRIACLMMWHLNIADNDIICMNFLIQNKQKPLRYLVSGKAYLHFNKHSPMWIYWWLKELFLKMSNIISFKSLVFVLFLTQLLYNLQKLINFKATQNVLVNFYIIIWNDACVKLTSCSDISCAHCIAVSQGFLSIKSVDKLGSGTTSTWSSAGLSEKLHWRPNSDRFLV